MPHDARSIANYFLKLAREHGGALSPMKLQKLVYFANGWHLAIRGEPLIDEQVEAWPYGPVIPSLYRDLRDFGDREITSPFECPATDVDPMIPSPAAEDLGLRHVEPTPDERGRDADFVVPLLRRVWDVYGRYSAVQLSNLTHAAGSPWSRVNETYGGKIPRGTDIPAELIREYFVGLARDRAEASPVAP